MAIISLTEQQSTTIPAAGMLHVEAYARGQASGRIRLDIDGEGTVNRVSESAVKLISGNGALQIRLSPGSGTEFGPGTNVQVVISRGRLGTPAATGAELPRITLDGRASTIVGSLNYRDGKLEIRAEGIRAERAMSGVSATIRAGMRPLLDRQGHQSAVATGQPVVIAVDTSASMAILATEGDLQLAVDIILGAVGALQPDSDFVLAGATGNQAVSVSEELVDRVLGEVAAGAGRIGAGVERPVNRDGSPSFAISDEALGEDRGSGLTILVGADVDKQRTAVDAQRVLRVTPALRVALENNDTTALRPVFESIIEACTGNTQKVKW